MRRKQMIVAIVGLIVLMLAVSGCGLFNKSQVTGTVTYEGGAPAADCVVLLGTSETTTDAAGAFTFKGVAQASYELSVTGIGNAQALQQVDVNDKDILVNVILQNVPAGNMTENPTFADAHKVIPPTGWEIYGTLGTSTVTLVNADDPAERALHIADLVAVSGGQGEIGLQQRYIPIEAGKTYRLTTVAKGVEGFTAEGASFQLRFLPSGERKAIPFGILSTTEFTTQTIEFAAPAGDKTAVIYIYTSGTSLPQFLLRQVALEAI